MVLKPFGSQQFLKPARRASTRTFPSARYSMRSIPLEQTSMRFPVSSYPKKLEDITLLGVILSNAIRVCSSSSAVVSLLSLQH
jgi:hypothetical protein